MSKSPLIECVPNFSEGRNTDVIRQITDQIEAVEGVKLLDVDPGEGSPPGPPPPPLLIYESPPLTPFFQWQ